MMDGSRLSIWLRPSGALRWLWVLAWFKVAYLGVVTGALALWPDMDMDHWPMATQRWPRQGGPVFASHFATWDAAHYLYLSEVGYSHGVRSCAFYPLWPLLIRWCAPLLGGSDVLTALVLANGLSLAAWLMFHRLVRRRWGERAADWALVFLIAYPGALFFQFNYSESVFLLLALLLWHGLEQARYGPAAVAGVLLPLARGVGVFAVAPIAWWAGQPLRDWWRGRGLVPARIGGPPPDANLGGGAGAARPALVLTPMRQTLRRSWMLVAPLGGWAAYLGLMWHWTGHPFEGFTAQRFWGVHAVGNLWNVEKFVVGFFEPTEWHAFHGSVLDRCVFVVLVYCLPVIWRLDKGLVAWTCMLGFVPAMSGTFTSFTRYACCVFPMFIALGVFVAPRSRRALRWATLAVFALLQVVLVWRFVNFRWAG